MIYQSDLKFGFGIQTNATFLTQQYGDLYRFAQTVIGENSDRRGGAHDQDAEQSRTKYPLPYLSKWSYTIAPYYEIGKLEIHTSYTWRSNYNVVDG